MPGLTPLRKPAPSGKQGWMPDSPAVKKYVSNTGVRIYRIHCQVFDALSASVYLLLGAGPPTLLDAGSGYGRSTRDILAGIESVRRAFGEPIQPGDIRRIIISHGHFDHLGGLTELLRLTSARVAVHSLDQIAVTSHHEYVVMGNSRLRTFFQQAGIEPARRERLLKLSHFVGTIVEPVEVQRTLADGEELDGLRILHTPGHSPGHICIGAGDVLFSFDHILARTVPQQWPEFTAPYTGLGHYLESLAKIERTPGIELTLPAHEQAIHNVYERIETIRRAYFRRLDRLTDMLRKTSRPLSVGEIADLLYPEVTGHREVLAVTDVGSRVEYLHQCGRLRVENLDEIERSETPVYRYVVA
jgi:glyoxylase-like metal-dependent hydrolase (beta-lactamase superfamily II)